MSDARGYSYSIVRAVQKARREHNESPVFAFAGFCVDANIPVARIAADMDTSRQTIYSWFTGRFAPKQDKLEKMIELHANYMKARV